MFGQQLSAALTASNVDTAHVITSDRPTTLAFVQLTNGHATYSFFDENSAGRMLLPEDIPVLPNEISALFFGGFSLECEPGADANAALIEQECKYRVVMIDPIVRPGFIRDDERYRTRLKAMISTADIVKITASLPMGLGDKVRHSSPIKLAEEWIVKQSNDSISQDPANRNDSIEPLTGLFRRLHSTGHHRNGIGH